MCKCSTGKVRIIASNLTNGTQFLSEVTCSQRHSHRASTSLANLHRQMRMHIWLFSLPFLTGLSKRSHSSLHLLLRAQGYPSPPSTGCRPSMLGVCLLASVFPSASLPPYIAGVSWCFPSGHLCFSLWFLLPADDLFSPASLPGWLEGSCSMCSCRAGLTVCLAFLYLSHWPCSFLRERVSCLPGLPEEDS